MKTHSCKFTCSIKNITETKKAVSPKIIKFSLSRFSANTNVQMMQHKKTVISVLIQKNSAAFLVSLS